MSKADEILKKVHEVLAFELNQLIENKIMDYSDKERLRYAVCLNDKEKLEVTKSQIKKMQKKLDKCNLNIAGYISALIIEDNLDKNTNYEQVRRDICYNFLYEYYEEVKRIAKQYHNLKSIENEDFEVWQGVLTDETYIFSTPDINHFIKLVVVVDRLKMYKSFLNIDVETKENTFDRKILYNNQNFTKFIKDIEYNYPLYHTPVSTYHQWQSNIKNLKTEILENLIILPESSKNPYLSKLEFELNSHLKYCYTLKKELDELYDFYETTEIDVLRWTSLNNELHIILNNEPKKYEFPFEGNFKMNPFSIQEKFYNYHYGNIINEAVIFINKEISDYHIHTNQNKEPNLGIDKKVKIINNLNSFKYTNSDSTRLTDLMNALKINKLIEKDTQLKDFRKIFSGDEIEKKIIWIGTLSELSYFIKSIHNTFQKIENTKQQLWKITSECFIQSDGKHYDKSKFRSQKPPASKENIDKLVQLL